MARSVAVEQARSATFEIMAKRSAIESVGRMARGKSFVTAWTIRSLPTLHSPFSTLNCPRFCASTVAIAAQIKKTRADRGFCFNAEAQRRRERREVFRTTRGQTPTRLYFNAETQSRRVSRGGKVVVGPRVFPHFGRAACPQAAATANRGRLRTIAPTSSVSSATLRLCVKQPPPEQTTWGQTPFLVGPLVLKRPRRRITGD